MCMLAMACMEVRRQLVGFPPLWVLETEFRFLHDKHFYALSHLTSPPFLYKVYVKNEVMQGFLHNAWDMVRAPCQSQRASI